MHVLTEPRITEMAAEELEINESNRRRERFIGTMAARRHVAGQGHNTKLCLICKGVKSEVDFVI